MLKVLFFIETLVGGGAEKVLRDLVNHMDQEKFDITVQTVWPCDATKYLVPGIRYRSMYPSASKINQLRYRAEAECGLAYRLHIKDDYDIECAYLEMGATKVLASSTNRRAVKLAWVHCGLTDAMKDWSSYQAKTAPWYQKYDCIVCVSQSVKESFEKIFPSSFRTEVLYNVVEDDVIRKKAEESIPGLQKRRATLLAVGRFSPQKNYARLLKSHERLLQEGVAHDLWILGDGEQRAQIEQYIHDHGLTDSVTLFGFQRNPYPYMKAVDLIVCASNFEGYSTVISESTILGKAIVTTECSGMREILGDSEYGLITKNNDEAFYQGLKKMIMDPDLQQVYAAKAALRGKQFSMQTLIDRSEAFLSSLSGMKSKHIT